MTEITKYHVSMNNLDVRKLKEMYQIKNMLNIKIDVTDNKLYLNNLIGEEIYSDAISINNSGLNIFNYKSSTDIRLENYLKMYSYQDLNLLVSDYQKIFDKETATIFIRNKSEN